MDVLYIVLLISTNAAFISSAAIDHQGYYKPSLDQNNTVPYEDHSKSDALEKEHPLDVNNHAEHPNKDFKSDNNSAEDQSQDMELPASRTGRKNNDEVMALAADTIYVPYVRYRQYFGQRQRVYVNRRSSNYYPRYPALVGYADDRDRFPTVA
ncbi:hypothetical protein NQ317_011096 [Molorchus minor]|uniref:Uncharacterized protein n=1 Tax=Molorchus minor TaxID=1323400 RepID=A0ABQ9K3N7_9CUCU|nr:hypothetical protein NQ317_011096 [Molorchus minor]